MRNPASRPHAAIPLAVLAFVLAARLAQAQATYQVADISTDPQSSDPVELVALGDTLLFTAFSPTDGLEIFRTDGTPDGTSQVTRRGRIASPCARAARRIPRPRSGRRSPSRSCSTRRSPARVSAQSTHSRPARV